jgi:peptidoglycan-N-acetylglucosamine deacetylase
VADGEPVRIGASVFDEDRVIAHVYAAGLRAQGVDAEVVELDGFRALEVASILDREIDVAVDYAGSLLEFLDGFASLASPDTDETVRTLRDLVAVAGYEVFAPAPATSANAFVVTASTAERYGLSSLSDLIEAAPAAEPTPPPGERPTVDEPLLLIGDDALRVGDTGPEVRQLQELLVEARYEPGPINGIFEEPTRRAVASFQADAGLPLDGVAGPQTIAALEEAVAAGEAGGTGPTDEPEPPGPTPDRPAPDGAVVHLTFDDGPNSTFTPQILDLLARYDAQAVFFAIGQQIGGGRAVIDRMVADGHRLGNHSWSHPSLAELSRPAFDQEIGRTQQAIAAATGAGASCLRPPYGAMSSQTRAWAAEVGLEVVLWDIDLQDWARPGVASIVGSVVDYARPGDVVLFHDGGGNREQTVAAMEQILAQLSDRGFAFTIAPGC